MPRGRPKGTLAEGTPHLAESSPRAAPTARRGRGRPPKKAVRPEAEAAQKVEVESEVEHESGGDTEPEVKKARMSSGSSEGPDPLLPDPEVATPTKRGRGRPKKSTVNTTDSGSNATSTPRKSTYIPTGRPRGRPPKSAKASVVTTSPAKASAAPTGRKRGRPPKNAGSSSATQPPLSDQPATPFSLENLVGSYQLQCPAISKNFEGKSRSKWGEERSLRISTDSLDENILAATFRFDRHTGNIALALSKAHLEDRFGEAEALVTSDIMGGGGTTKGQASTSKAVLVQGNESGAEGDVDDSDDELESSAPGEKRKAVASPEPVKRGRGRPPKKKKVDSTPIPLPTVYFVYHSQAPTSAEGGPFYGTIKPDDKSCRSFQGVFDNFPDTSIPPPVSFRAVKDVQKADKAGGVSFEFEEEEVSVEE